MTNTDRSKSILRQTGFRPEVIARMTEVIDEQSVRCPTCGVGLGRNCRENGILVPTHAARLAR